MFFCKNSSSKTKTLSVFDVNFFRTTKAIVIDIHKGYRILWKQTKEYQSKTKIMAASIITTEDLMEFKIDLLQEIKKIIQSSETNTIKKWLKSKEVTKLLNISPGTLQNLRINGTLTYTKIGGTIYYDNTAIEKLLNTNKVPVIPTLFK